MDLEIHTAIESDAEELRRYAARLFAEGAPGIYRRLAPTLEEERAFVLSRIDPPNSTLLVARVDDAIVGLLDFEGGSYAEDAHVGTFGLSVDAVHRGRGIGTALLEALLAWAPAHDIRRIEVRAWANNPGSIRLYERLGFEREGVLRGAILTDGEAVDVVLLARVFE